MRQIKTKQDVEIVDGNQLIGKVIDDNDPFVTTCVDLIDKLPDSKDLDRVLAIKKKIDAGNYDFDKNLDKVVNTLLSDSSDPTSVAFPLFERWFSLFHMG